MKRLLILTWLAMSILLIAGAACAGGTAAANQSTPVNTASDQDDITLPSELVLPWPPPAATVPPGLVFRTDRLYTQWHLWVKQESADTVRLGVTYYGQLGLGKPDDLGLPQVGMAMVKGSSFDCFIVGDDCMIYDFAAPFNGQVIAVNESLKTDPRLINISPYDDGWLVLVRIENPDDLDGLLTYAQYFGTSCPPCHCNH